MSTHSDRDCVLLMAAERIAKESRLMCDVLRGETTVEEIRPSSLVPILTEGLRSTSGIHDASMTELQEIAASVRHAAAQN